MIKRRNSYSGDGREAYMQWRAHTCSGWHDHGETCRCNIRPAEMLPERVRELEKRVNEIEDWRARVKNA